MTVEQITKNAKKLVELQKYIDSLKEQLPHITAGNLGFYPNGFSFSTQEEFDKIKNFITRLAEEKIKREETNLQKIIVDMGFPEVCL